MFKICKIQLIDYQQFQNTMLDFTHTETGETLDGNLFQNTILIGDEKR